MAKRKSTKKRRSTRKGRRGMGAIPNVKNLTSGVMEVAGAVGGAIAASYVTNKLLDKFMTNTPSAKHGLVMVGGILIDGMVKQPLLKSVAKGMAISGGLNLAKTLVPAIGAITESDVTSLMEDITIGDDVISEDVTIGGDDYGVGEDIISEDLTIGEDVIEFM